jgi:nucleotide-binding universal stress UspA family protein
MLPFRSILCPVDFSDESRSALRCAAALAMKFQGELIVLNALEPLLDHAARTRYGLDLAMAETEPALREFVKPVLPAGANLPKVEYVVRVGDASTVILDAAAKGASLIVMGTHGLGGFRKLVLGSTTERVLRETRVPVLAVPAHGASTVLDPSGTQFAIESILAATDFSQTATDALRLAAELAASFSVPLIVTHVVTPVVVPLRWQSYVVPADDERLKSERERLETSLRDLSIRVHGEVVVSVGRPTESIAALAEEKKAGLIVMGLFAETSAFGRRPGSIAYRVASMADVPVLVVPPRA